MLGTLTGHLAMTPLPTPSLDCVAEADSFCQVVLDITDNPTLARAADWLIARPVRVLLIVVLAMLLRYVVRRVVDRVVERLAEGRLPSGRLPEGRARQVVVGASPLATARLRQRSEAMGSVLKSVASFLIVVIAGMMVLSEFGLDLAPLIASAGIAGVALGFGAQNLVKDFLAGVFMIFEDQYGVGDVINTGHASGTVESVGLRVTQLRDADGVMWYVRNGEVLRIGNESQGWATATVEVQLDRAADRARAEQLLADTAIGMYADEEWARRLDEAPTVSATGTHEPGAVVLRVAARTRPHDDLAVTAELERRAQLALAAAEIPVRAPETPASAGQA